MGSRNKRGFGLLPHVVQALADMEDANGTPVKDIIDKVRTAVYKSDLTKQNVITEVRKALRIGIEAGLLVYSAGKYRMALNQKDKLSLPDGGDGLARQCRRRRRRRRRRSSSRSPRRRRRRRRSGSRRRRRRRRRSLHGSPSDENSKSDISNLSTVSKKSNPTTNVNKLPTSGDEDAHKPEDVCIATASRGETNFKKRSLVPAMDMPRKKRMKKSKEVQNKKDKDEDASFEIMPRKSMHKTKSRMSTRISRRSRSRKLMEANEQFKEDKSPSQKESNSSVEEQFNNENSKEDPRDSYLN